MLGDAMNARAPINHPTNRKHTMNTKTTAPSTIDTPTNISKSSVNYIPFEQMTTEQIAAHVELARRALAGENHWDELLAIIDTAKLPTYRVVLREAMAGETFIDDNGEFTVAIRRGRLVKPILVDEPVTA